jgi:hypothetical protein
MVRLISLSRIKLTCLDFTGSRRYYSLAVQTVSLQSARSGMSGSKVFASVMEAFTKIRQSLREKKHIYALAVTLLALCMLAQAVHAKNSDYLPKTNQAVRFSTTVKIADLAQHVVVANPGTVSVPRGVLPLTQPQSTRALHVAEVPAPEVSAQFSFRPLRSPPQNS